MDIGFSEEQELLREIKVDEDNYLLYSRKREEARIGEALADRADDLGLRDVEKVVVAPLVLRKVEGAAIIGFLKPVLLDERAIGAVLDEDALRSLGSEFL